MSCAENDIAVLMIAEGNVSHVSGVHFWFGKDDVNYGEGLHSSCSVQLSNVVPKK